MEREYQNQWSAGRARAIGFQMDTTVPVETFPVRQRVFLAILGAMSRANAELSHLY